MVETQDGTLSTQQSPRANREGSERPPSPTAQTPTQPVHQPRTRIPSPDPGVFQRHIVEKAEEIVRDCRAGKITRPDALGKLFFTFDLAGNHPNHSAREKAFEEFRAELAQQAQLEEAAGERGRRILDATQQGGDGLNRPTVPPAEDVRTGSGGTATLALQDHLADLQRLVPRKRPRDDGDDYNSGDESDGRGRPKLQREQLPWAMRGDEDSSDERNINGPENRKLLRLFSINPSFVVSDIRLCASSPPGFPQSEWNAIVRGNAVNLDNVFSNLHHVHPPKENIGRLGDREITFGAPKPAKVVETHADWHAAWSTTVLAYSFVFPHRRAELDAYGQYILRLFAAKVLSAAGRVILYDRAVRNFVGGGQRFALTDYESYSNLREAILSADGVEGSSVGGSAGNGGKGRGSRAGRSSGVCDRFNRPGGCGWKDGECRYKHECKQCGKDGHGQASCKGGRSEKA
jgi:hypothetical protein